MILDPQNLHPFIYTRNNTINLIDLKGLACGDKFTDPIIPDFPFEDACEAHDECYGCKGKIMGKSKAYCDNKFLWDMTRICLKFVIVPPISGNCMMAANMYYLAVVHFGEDAFSRARENCFCGKPPSEWYR